MLLILINETYALIIIVRSVLKFYIVFLDMLFFQTIWRNKNEHKKHKNKMKKEENESVFKISRNLPMNDYVELLSFRCQRSSSYGQKQNLVLNFQTRCLVYVIEQPSSVGVVRVSPFERSMVEPRYTTGFQTF